MLPAHFHDVTYDHFGKKVLQELRKTPARNTRTIFEHRGARATSNAELNSSIIIINTSFFNSWTTDSPDLIKVLIMSKTTQAFTNSTKMYLFVRYVGRYVLRSKREFSDLNWFKSDSSAILS